MSQQCGGSHVLLHTQKIPDLKAGGDTEQPQGSQAAAHECQPRGKVVSGGARAAKNLLPIIAASFSAASLWETSQEVCAAVSVI